MKDQRIRVRQRDEVAHERVGDVVRAAVADGHGRTRAQDLVADLYPVRGDEGGH